MKHTQGEWKMRPVSDEDFGYEIGLSSRDVDAIACVYRSPEVTANAKLIADCPVMFQYILKKANEGDEEAKKIIQRHA